MNASRATDVLLADYEVLRHGVGARRSARDVVTVTGRDAEPYLQGQVTQDVAALADGGTAETLVLSPEGKVEGYARVTRMGRERFVLDTEPGAGEALASRLSRFKLRSKVAIVPERWHLVALRGEGTATLAPDAGGPDVLGLAVSWHGWTGLDLLAESPPSVPGAARQCGEAAFEACRVERGIPVVGRELDERTIPAEAGLLARTVSFTKGCYTGQELVARLDARGNRVPRHLRAVVLEAADGPPAAALVGVDLHATPEPEAGARPAGRITTAAWCPGVGATAGLAYVHRSIEPGGTVYGTVPGPDPLTFSVRELPLVAVP